jgi:hypothetical protein
VEQLQCRVTVHGSDYVHAYLRQKVLHTGVAGLTPEYRETSVTVLLHGTDPLLTYVSSNE